jgi:hypothetical protein
MWLDGLHDGTHVHWQLSPLSVLSLEGMWQFLKPLDTWKSHFQAIIRIAGRRRSLQRYSGTMPSSTKESDWSAFFEAQPKDKNEILKEASDWHRRWIASGDISPNPSRLFGSK